MAQEQVKYHKLISDFNEFRENNDTIAPGFLRFCTRRTGIAPDSLLLSEPKYPFVDTAFIHYRLRSFSDYIINIYNSLGEQELLDTLELLLKFDKYIATNKEIIYCDIFQKAADKCNIGLVELLLSKKFESVFPKMPIAQLYSNVEIKNETVNLLLIDKVFNTYSDISCFYPLPLICAIHYDNKAVIDKYLTTMDILKSKFHLIYSLDKSTVVKTGRVRNTQEIYDVTLLHIACFYDNLDLVKILLSLGLNPLLQAGNKLDAIEFAIAGNAINCLDFLIKHNEPTKNWDKIVLARDLPKLINECLPDFTDSDFLAKEVMGFSAYCYFYLNSKKENIFLDDAKLQSRAKRITKSLSKYLEKLKKHPERNYSMRKFISKSSQISIYSGNGSSFYDFISPKPEHPKKDIDYASMLALSMGLNLSDLHLPKAIPQNYQTSFKNYKAQYAFVLLYTLIPLANPDSKLSEIPSELIQHIIQLATNNELDFNNKFNSINFLKLKPSTVLIEKDKENNEFCLGV